MQNADSAPAGVPHAQSIDYRRFSHAEREARLTELAARQWGVLAARQLRALGFDRSAIDRRLRNGRLVWLHHGVYALGHAELRLEGRWMAAVLACGEGAVLSHRSAAHLWELRATTRRRIEVTVQRSGARSTPAIEVHVTRRLAPSDVVRHRGIPVTSPARTLADLAAVLRGSELERALETAEAARRLDAERLQAAAYRRQGAAVLRQILNGWAPAPTRHELERRLLALVRTTSHPQPEANAQLLGFEVDLLWRERKLVVEADSHAYHGTRAALERDRRRDAILTAAGYRVLRVTWQQVTAREGEVLAALEAILGA